MQFLVKHFSASSRLLSSIGGQAHSTNGLTKGEELMASAIVQRQDVKMKLSFFSKTERSRG